MATCCKQKIFGRCKDMKDGSDGAAKCADFIDTKSALPWTFNEEKGMEKCVNDEHPCTVESKFTCCLEPSEDAETTTTVAGETTTTVEAAGADDEEDEDEEEGAPRFAALHVCTVLIALLGHLYWQY